MARKALVVKQQKLEKLRQKYYQLVLKAREEKTEVPKPKRWKPAKYYRRCGTTGKVRSFMRDFGVSRQAFRRYARQGIVMGLRKASR